MYNRARQLGFLIVGVAAILISVAPAAARLGETYSACDGRYGRPRESLTNGRLQVRKYEKSAYIVVASFRRGVVVEISYERRDGALLGDREIAHFLKVNRGKSRWHKVDQVAQWKRDHPGQERDPALQAALMDDLASFMLFARNDGSAEATYDRGAGVLLVIDAAHLKEERQRARKAEEDAAALMHPAEVDVLDGF